MKTRAIERAQFTLFDEPPPSLDVALTKPEDQWFERKSARIEPRALTDAMIGFANADGGRIVVGVSDGVVEGVNGDPKRLNDLQQAALDYSSPPVRHRITFLDCIAHNGVPNRLLVIDVEASEQIHRDKSGKCYLRVGDENRRLGPVEERELAFDKGEATFDNRIVKELALDDLDMDDVALYGEKLGASSTASLLRSRGIYYDQGSRHGVTQAGWLLFGKTPPIWSYIRYLRYSGTRVETGERSNVTEDIRLEGAIPSLIDQAKSLLSEKIGTAIRLTPSGRFERVPTLPEFAWLEAIVNAVTHRSYSLQGDGVRVREFDDRLEVESPGRLPGLVRVENIRHSRFSRNPHIARVLAEMTGYVRELNEGVQRIFEEMERYGLGQPVYSATESSVRVVLYKQPDEARTRYNQALAEMMTTLRGRLDEDRLKLLLSTLKSLGQMASREIAELLGVTAPTARRYMSGLEAHGLVRQVRKSPRDPTGAWVVTDTSFWSGVPPDS